MKLIKSSYKIIEPTGYTIDDIYKSIELVGRVSHKSEHNIKEGSAKEFVDRMLNMKHLATYEFGTVYLYYKVDRPSTMTKEIIDFYKNNQYSKVKCINNYSNTYSECGMGRLYDIEYSEYFITTNLRVCIENNRKEYLTNALCEPTEYHEKRVCVKFICDRAIANEFVRHRKFSFLQESTRYCNYSKGKFNNELTFIEPCWAINMDMFKEDPGVTAEYTYDYTEQEKNISASAILFEQLEGAEKSYLELIKRGWKPEQARNVLPLSLKTELYMCGYAEDWENFFKQRDDKQHAHPEAYELAHPLHEEFIKRGYINE